MILDEQYLLKYDCDLLKKSHCLFNSGSSTAGFNTSWGLAIGHLPFSLNIYLSSSQYQNNNTEICNLRTFMINEIDD